VAGLTDAELWESFVGEAAVHGVSGDLLEEIRRRVHEDNPAGFQWFYRLVREFPPPPYFRTWAEDLYASGGRWANEAFRGSTKTSTITETFTAYQIGLHPERSNGFVQASEVSAKKHTSNVADMIEHNPAFRLLFPEVIPDKEKGWGAHGYWVKRADIDEGTWTRMRHQDPTLYAGSYGNSIHIGRHPTGVFCMDDINDDKNTESERKTQEVNRWVTDTLFPALENTAWRIINQTPWTKRDALALIKSTGVWKHTWTPVLRIGPEGVGEHIVIERDGNILFDKWGVLTWPDRFDAAMISDKFMEQNTRGIVGFARMYLLDLSAAEGVFLKKEWLHEYPRESINESWGVVIGVDYASTADKIKEKDRDYFTLAVGRLLPGGGVVLVDGFRGHVSQGEALQLTNSWARNYPTLQMVCVESHGKGQEFYYLLLANSRIPLIPGYTGNKSKGERFEKQMAPLFQFSRVWVTDMLSEFEREFEQEWVAWPNTEHDDCLDAVYYMTEAAAQIGSLAPPRNTVVRASHWAIPQERKQSNPWNLKSGKVESSAYSW